MLRREKGWGFQDGHPDIWTVMADTAQNQLSERLRSYETKKSTANVDPAL